MYHQKGQVLLIVVLIMVIALTVGLTLISRSIINLKTTSEQSDSQKAFNAAEAGVEIGLQKSLTSSTITIGQKTLDNSATINSVIIQPITGSTITLNNGNPVLQDQGTDVWLTNYPNYSGTPWTGNIQVYWGSKSGCSDAALEIIAISGSSGTDPNATISRYGFDPCGANSVDTTKDRTGQNKFSPASRSAIAGSSFNFVASMSITNGLLMRIIPLYASTPILILGTNAGQPQSFPSQGRIITSVGSYGSTKRKISFFQGYPMISSEFFYGFFQSP